MGGGSGTSSGVGVRRSSQYEIPSYPEPIYETASATAPRQQKYLATSKSSSNLYLQPQYNDLGPPGSNRSMGRQQKTLSMHGAPNAHLQPPVSNRNNAVMETAASIIANAHQSGIGLGTSTDWWNTNQMSSTSYAAPAPLQHDWSQKNLWNPAASFGASIVANATAAAQAVGAGHPLGHSATSAQMPVFFLLFFPLFFDFFTPV